MALLKLQDYSNHADPTFVAEQEKIKQASKAFDNAQKYYQKRDYRATLYHANQALGTASKCPKLKLLKAECLVYLKRYSESQDMVTSLHGEDPLNPDSFFIKGLMLYYQDNPDKALIHFAQALKLGPDHTKAQAAFKRAKNLKNKKDEGNAAYKANNLDEALKLYTEALTIDPLNSLTNAKLYFNRAIIYAKVKLFSNPLLFDFKLIIFLPSIVYRKAT